MVLVQDDDVVQAFTPETPDQPLDVRILPPHEGHSHPCVALPDMELNMTPIILHADHLILMNQNTAVIPNGAVVVGSDGRMQAVGEAPVVIAAHPGVEVRRLENRLVMPVLIDTDEHYVLLGDRTEGLPV